MAFPTTTYTSNRGAASGMVNNAAAAGLSVNALNEIAQIQSVVANLLLGTPGGAAASLLAAATIIGANGAAASLSGTTVPLTLNAASGAITFNGNVGTGTGAVGGFIFKVPVTGASSSTAQTLTTALTISATTVISAAFAGSLTVGGNFAVNTTNLTVDTATGAVVIGNGNLTIAGTALTLGTAGAAMSINGTTTALTADVASGATTINANVGTGTGAVGGFIFRVPVTGASSSTAQTLTTVLTLNATTVVRAAFAGAISAVGGIMSSTPAGGVGYATGAGSTVTQITDRSTTVVINAVCGRITTMATSLAALDSVTFTVTNSSVAIGDVVVLNQRSGSTANTSIIYVSTVAAGSFAITLYNRNPITADTGAMLINFAVIKGVTS